MEKFQALLGLIAFPLIAYGLSRHRQNVSWQLVAWGIGLQLLLALLILGLPSLGFNSPFTFIFKGANDVIVATLNFTLKGSKFIFGSFMDPSKHDKTFALYVLPTIIFMASLMAILYHLGLMQLIVKAFAWVMIKTMKLSGAESLAAAANIFVGQTEAPLVVKPFIHKMTQSELFSLMTGGMATVAGGVLAAYVTFLHKLIPDIAGHLLTASVMSAPAALMMAKLIYPETEKPLTQSTLPKSINVTEVQDNNVIEAAARGAGEGLKLALNVGAMLLAFIALIAMVNALMGVIGGWIGFDTWGSAIVPEILQTQYKTLNLELLMGWLFAPIAWLMGIPSHEIVVSGIFIGEKIVLNEFYAYIHLAEVGSQLSPRTMLILSYGLCGFANFSSIAIQIGGIGGIAPSRQKDLARFGILSVIGGSLAAFMTATIAGLLI